MWSISQQLKLDHYYMICENSIRDNMHVDVNLLELKIDWLINSVKYDLLKSRRSQGVKQ